jgi:hypothetical protein
MNREKALKSLLVLFGLFFVAAVYPIVMYLWQPGNEPPGDTMMLSLYFTLGIFLLLAARNPSKHRSLIAYAGWANIAHAAVMALMAIHPASRPQRSADRRGSSRFHWGSPDRTGSEEAVKSAGTRSRSCVRLNAVQIRIKAHFSGNVVAQDLQFGLR